MANLDKSGAELLQDAIAFARVAFEELAVRDRHQAASIFDRPFLLQVASGQADAGTIRAEHRGQEIMRDLQGVAADSILHGQKPASQALLDAVKPIASGGLRCMHPLNHRVATRDLVQARSGGKDLPQMIEPNAKSIAFQLHHSTKWAVLEADESGHSDESFSAHGPHFYGLAFPHVDNKRHQTSVEKVHDLQLLSGLVQIAVHWQVLKK